MKNKSRGTLAERVCNALDISPDTLPHRSLIEIHSQSLVKIQNAGSILLYSPEEIRVSLPRPRFIRVCGEGLSCSSYNKGALGITGKIISISFEEEKK